VSDARIKKKIVFLSIKNTGFGLTVIKLITEVNEGTISLKTR